jgi:3-oxoacyl-[acyl-carrier protein] reductase
VRRLATESLAALGGTVDILVNNAGQPRVAPSESLPEADYRYTLDLNLNGCFVLTQEIVHGMLAAGSGVIIHVSSPCFQRGASWTPRSSPGGPPWDASVPLRK